MCACICEVKEKSLRSYRKNDLHITLDSVTAVINWFWSHPFHRKLLCILSTVHVFINLSHQPKVWHFHSVITANQNITSCQVTMNEAFLCEMILKIGTQCVHVSAIWKFNDHVGKKQHTLCEQSTFAFCLRSFWVSLWMLESEVREWPFFIFLSLSWIS